ncbi:MAG: hypothetical protein CMO46_09665, partial [Verrucomicrobiales bacterium]|nr:hypothetical protein [Verrucomicrobiales bacterium]
PEVLIALKDKQRPDFDVHQFLKKLLNNENNKIKASVVNLIGEWEVNELVEEVLKIAENSKIDSRLRVSAFTAVGIIGGQEALNLATKVGGDANDPCQLEAIGAVISMHAPDGIKLAVRVLNQNLDSKSLSKIFDAVASRNGAMKLMAEELLRSKIDKEKGGLIRQTWIAKGLVSPELSSSLDKLAGIPLPKIEYTQSNIEEFVKLGKEGDFNKGVELFKSAKLGCIACHKVTDIGGVIGPDLSALGSGVPFERIVTEVMWPTLQVKEGFSLTRVVTKKSQTLQGYEQASREKEKILLRDFATGLMHRILKDDIASMEKIGSLMPPTAQSLSKEEIGNLMAYLFNLRG